ncbi:hypothetical protein RFI_07452, partial [Reticulomyxa filosa]
KLEEIQVLVWMPGVGASEFLTLPPVDGDAIKVHLTDPQTQQRRVKSYAVLKSSKNASGFRDESILSSAINTLYLYTNYIFINKTGLDMDFRHAMTGHRSFTMKQIPVVVEIFENQRKNLSKEWEASDRFGRPKDHDAIDLPDKWKWSGEWISSDWEYAKDFHGGFHSNCLQGDHVRRRKWTRVREAKDEKMSSTVTLFGGTTKPITNKIAIRLMDKHVQTNWSNTIPLSEAVANNVISLPHLSIKKTFFDISVVFELHRLFPSIKVIKFYPRYISVNLTTRHRQLYLRPSFQKKEKKKKRHSLMPRRASMPARSPISSIDRTTTPSPDNPSSASNSESFPYDEKDDVSRELPLFSKNVSPTDEMNYGIPLHWFNNTAKCYVECSADRKQWSNPFPIHEIAQYGFWLPTEDGEEIIRVQVDNFF